MTPGELATLHARAFVGQGRAWSAEEFTDLLNSPYVFLISRPGGFALGRCIAGEAELLTIATQPDQRRQGLGRALLAGFETAARGRGADQAFLEVAEGNRAARGLYAQAGYDQIARRDAYYQTPEGTREAALMLRKFLTARA